MSCLVRCISNTRRFRRQLLTADQERERQEKLASQLHGIVGQSCVMILLVFGKDDGQSEAFCWAAVKMGYQCNLVHNSESALSSFLEKHHDLIIIDDRHSKYFDAQALCRSIRATKTSEHAVILAVTRKHEKEEPSISPLLDAGFNRRFIENHTMSVCMNELLSIVHSEIRSRTQLQAAHALLAAVENCPDAIEVTNEDRETQYVNPAYERLFGFTCEELVGKDSRDLAACEKNPPDIVDTVNAQLKKGKPWEGLLFGKRKSGELVPHHCRVAPVSFQSGRVRHYVCTKSLGLSERYNADINYELIGYRNVGRHKGSFDLQSLSSVDGFHMTRRRESMSKMHSTTIEAPITKVINIINAAQENSPMMVVQALDRVLEILRSSELYNPSLGQQIKEDQMTNDLMGGLMTTQGIKRKFSTEIHIHKAGNMHLLNNSAIKMPQIPPEISTLLDSEPEWDFDVIELEKITSKRPLVYLGMRTFKRFGVCEFLQISDQLAYTWLQMIEANYHDSNPYHNSTHAADVLHATAYFLSQTKLQAICEPLDVVSALIAAVIHDLDHPGRTNSYLVNAVNDLALQYNDLAVLESHHVSIAFQLSLKDERVNIFKNLDRDDFRLLRQQIVDMVLATEMTKHFEHLHKFISSINMTSGTRQDDDAASMMSRMTVSSVSPDLTSNENRVLIKRMLIKCADISNPTRPLALCAEWAYRIAEEYCRQTDEERQKDLPVVMPVFDRKTCNIPKSQTSFIDIFINGMFDAWHVFLDIPDLMNHLENNYKYWKEQEMKNEAEKKSDTDSNT